MYPEVHTLASANLRWSGVEAQGSPTPQRLTVISSSPPTKMEDPTTMEHLKAVTKPIQAWGNLHNSIGGSQESPLRHHKAWEDLHNLIGGPQVISMEAPQSLGRSPQLNWRSPSNPLSH
jgi:hypothetical protein